LVRTRIFFCFFKNWTNSESVSHSTYSIPTGGCSGLAIWFISIGEYSRRILSKSGAKSSQRARDGGCFWDMLTCKRCYDDYNTNQGF
jgi:hypothetical protein